MRLDRDKIIFGNREMTSLIGALVLFCFAIQSVSSETCPVVTPSGPGQCSCNEPNRSISCVDFSPPQWHFNFSTFYTKLSLEYSRCLDLSSLDFMTPSTPLFENLPELETLTITSSWFPSTTERASGFQGLGKLKRLDLRLNDLRFIGADFLKGLTSLTSLDLSYNKLGSIDKNAFSGLSNLTYLDLSHNWEDGWPYFFLPDGVFDDLVKLDELRATWTGLNAFPVASLKKALKGRVMKRLDLSSSYSNFQVQSKLPCSLKGEIESAVNIKIFRFPRACITSGAAAGTYFTPFKFCIMSTICLCFLFFFNRPIIVQ